VEGVEYVSIKNVKNDVLNVEVLNSVRIILTNTDVLNVKAPQSVYITDAEKGVKIANIYLFVNTKIVKLPVNYVNKNAHVSTTKLERNVMCVTQHTLIVNIASIRTFVEYVPIGHTVFMTSINLGVRNAEGVRYVNLRSVIKWP
jgi:hypothetical protein